MNHLERLLPPLEAIADVRVVWPRGLMHDGGPHRRLASSVSPISIGEDECAVFGRLIAALRPRTCFIVGNAFGLSSAYIALAMQEHGGEHVITLDAETEGDGASCAHIARALAAGLDLPILKNKRGYSPRDIPQAVETDQYDLVFIDGCHGHPAVTHDFRGAVPFAREDAVFVWHDFWFPGVRHGVRRAMGDGFRCLWVPTSCEMVLGTRDEARFEELRALFPEGDPDPDRHYRPARYAARWLLRSVPVYLAVLAERLARRAPLRELPSGRSPDGGTG
ncbi:MAG: class I SAM-dependent methyltransferase [Myxococcota bacterium]